MYNNHYSNKHVVWLKTSSYGDAGGGGSNGDGVVECIPVSLGSLLPLTLPLPPTNTLNSELSSRKERGAGAGAGAEEGAGLEALWVLVWVLGDREEDHRFMDDDSADGC